MKKYRYYADGGEKCISEEELREVSPDVQREVMEHWFHENFQDPEDGGAIFTHGRYMFFDGGPYEPHEVLFGEFENLLPEELIDRLATDLMVSRHQEWSPREGGEFYEPDDEIDWGSPRPRVDFDVATRAIELLLSESENVAIDVRNHFYRLLYVNVITALEVFLSDSFSATVKQAPAFIRRLVEMSPAKKNIASDMDFVDFIFRDYLKKFDKRSLSDKKEAYKKTLNIEFPQKEWREVRRCVETRHIIIHRNGKLSDDNLEISISCADVKKLLDVATKLVKNVDEQIARRLGEFLAKKD